MRRLRPLLVGIALVSAAILPLLPSTGQEPAAAPQPTRIVLRVSTDFIQKLMGASVARDEAVQAMAGDTPVTGTAHVSARFHLEVHESKTENDFDVVALGDIATQLTATRPALFADFHGDAPILARRPIVHRGDRFVGDAVTIEVQNRFTLDDIRPHHGGMTGLAIRSATRPFLRRAVSDGDCQANDEIRRRMTQSLTVELDKLAETLNQIPPLVKKGYDVLILEGGNPPPGVQEYRAATPHHLLFSIAGPGRRIPDLPTLPRDQQAPLELWVGVSKNAFTEVRRNFLVQNWRMVTPYLRDQLLHRSPELAKEVAEPLERLLDEVRIQEADGWHVIALGPKIAR
jgi:hypothetical protein